MSTVLEYLASCANPPRSFSYQLADHCELILDARKIQTPQVKHRDVYFVGHRTLERGQVRYHLSVMFADDPGALDNALIQVQKRIMDKYKLRFQCVPVYIRNLYSYDEVVEMSAFHQGITKEISDHQFTNEYGKFLVYGLLGDTQLFLQCTAAKDAYAAISQGTSVADKLPNGIFTPLKIGLTEPVSEVFDVVVERRAEIIKTFLDTTPAYAEVLH